MTIEQALRHAEQRHGTVTLRDHMSVGNVLVLIYDNPRPAGADFGTEVPQWLDAYEGDHLAVSQVVNGRWAGP